MNRLIAPDKTPAIPAADSGGRADRASRGSPAARQAGQARAGFTLVEMLVAVGLVVLMMSLFATIFQFATSAMAVQKGVAENDQKVRLVMTLLRGDLKNRTMLEVLPFLTTDTDDTNRLGYFYYAENDPDDGTDDILQFTVAAPGSDDLLYGRGVQLTNAGASLTPPEPEIAVNPNQPEFDDGYVVSNSVGSSQNAEVSYFLRHGILYRRVALIRQPTIAVNFTDAHPYNPKIGTGSAEIPLTNYLTGAPAATYYNFYSDFDYSAHYDVSSTGPAFHGIQDLDAFLGKFPLGKTFNRFGFDSVSGLPREFTNTSTVAGVPRFFGRFTHEETSFRQTNPTTASFGYPARVSADAPNPYNGTLPSPNGIPLTYDDSTGKVVQYAGGTRIGEDILMTNVHQFDIKLWDDGSWFGPDGVPGSVGDDNPNAANGPDDQSEVGWPGSDDGSFVDLGHNGFFPAMAPFNGTTDVSYYSKNITNPTINVYCPAHPSGKAGVYQYRFDTWHPSFNITGNPGNDAAPYRAPNPLSPSLGQPTTRPLRAIQIKIRFFDQTSQQLRDVTFVQSLTDY
jgi:type II secretory pathway pseudopilin PulG